MAVADVEASIVAIREGGWGDRRGSLQFFIRHPRAYPFVAETSDGEIVGTAIATAFGQTGWVGLVFVSPALRGRGLGNQLTRAAVECLERAGCRGILLAATDLGRPVYDRLGFRQIGEYAALTGPSVDTAPEHHRLRPLSDAHLPAVCALDFAASGEDRSHVINAIGEGWVAIQGETVHGYALRAPWGLGPVIADNPADGTLLVDVVRGAAPAGQMIINTAGENVEALMHLRAAGFHEQRRLARMVLGEPPAWRQDWVFTIFSFALG